MVNLGFAKAMRFKEIEDILSNKHSVIIIYAHLIYNAAIGVRTVKFREHSVTLQKNQLIISTRDLGKKLNIHFTTISRGLGYLKKIGVIEVESCGKFSLITLPETLNSEKYATPSALEAQEFDGGACYSNAPQATPQATPQSTRCTTPDATPSGLEVQGFTACDKTPQATPQSTRCTTPDATDLKNINNNITNNPPISPLTAKTKKSKKEFSESAVTIYKYFLEKIEPIKSYVKPQASKNNIEFHLKIYSVELLRAAIDNYLARLDENENEDQKYRKGPSNFFGRKGESESFFVDFLPENFEAEDVAYIEPLFIHTYDAEQKEQKRLLIKAEKDARAAKQTKEFLAARKKEAAERFGDMTQEEIAAHVLSSIDGISTRHDENGGLGIYGDNRTIEERKAQQIADLRATGALDEKEKTNE